MSVNLWKKDGLLHREDGPAVIGSDGYEEWCLNGKLHREDGPARIWSDGREMWYLNGKQVTEQEHKARTFKEIEEMFDMNEDVVHHDGDSLKILDRNSHRELHEAYKHIWEMYKRCNFSDMICGKEKERKFKDIEEMFDDI